MALLAAEEADRAPVVEEDEGTEVRSGITFSTVAELMSIFLSKQRSPPSNNFPSCTHCTAPSPPPPIPKC